MKLKLLFKTEPHGAQSISHIEDCGDNSEPQELGGNSLINIADDQKREIILTGEEMDSLAAQWLKMRGSK